MAPPKKLWTEFIQNSKKKKQTDSVRLLHSKTQDLTSAGGNLTLGEQGFILNPPRSFVKEGFILEYAIMGLPQLTNILA